jgi:hypothetical protein
MAAAVSFPTPKTTLLGMFKIRLANGGNSPPLAASSPLRSLLQTLSARKSFTQSCLPGSLLVHCLRRLITSSLYISLLIPPSQSRVPCCSLTRDTRPSQRVRRAGACTPRLSLMTLVRPLKRPRAMVEVLRRIFPLLSPFFYSSSLDHSACEWVYLLICATNTVPELKSPTAWAWSDTSLTLIITLLASGRRSETVSVLRLPSAAFDQATIAVGERTSREANIRCGVGWNMRIRW